MGNSLHNGRWSPLALIGRADATFTTPTKHSTTEPIERTGRQSAIFVARHREPTLNWTPPCEDEPQPLNGLAELDENQTRRVTSWMISAAVSRRQPPSWGDTGMIASDLATFVVQVGGYFG